MAIKLEKALRLRQFLSDHQTAVTALPIDESGVVHAATLLYYHTEEPLRLYFVTDIGSEKCKLLKTSEYVSGACVVGTEKSTTFTLQMRGEFRLKRLDKHADVVTALYTKRAGKDDDLGNPTNSLLEFIPNWARFTDYSEGYSRYLLDLK